MLAAAFRARGVGRETVTSVRYRRSEVGARSYSDRSRHCAQQISWPVLGYVVPWTAVLGRAERPIVATANGT